MSLFQTGSNVASFALTIASGFLLAVNLTNYVNDSNDHKHTASFIFTLISLVICALKAIRSVMIFFDGEQRGSNIRVGLGSILLAFNSVLLGTHYKDEYYDSVLAIFIMVSVDRLANLILSYDDPLDLFRMNKDPKFYKEESVYALLMLLGASVVISALDFGISDHYDDDQGEWGVALAGIIVAGVHLVLVGFVLLDVRTAGLDTQYVSWSRIPAVRSLAAGVHVALLAIHVGHLSAADHENMAMLIALQLLVVADIYGRNDGKTVL